MHTAYDQVELSRQAFNHWINTKDREHVSWLARYLNKNKVAQRLLVEHALQSIGEDGSGRVVVKDDRGDVVEKMAVLDALCGSEGAKLTARIKTAWNQHKYRTKLRLTNQKNINMVLSTRAIENLKTLSENLYKPQNKVIEDLIQEKLLLLAEKGQLRQPSPSIEALQMPETNIIQPEPLSRPLAGANLYESKANAIEAPLTKKYSKV